jgi:hypothetical protein
MGDRSTAYVQKSYQFAQQNTDKLGADFGMSDYTQDYTLEGHLREVETALTQLSEDFNDTMLALRSDLMVRSNLAYGLMKVIGKSSGNFDELRKDMGQRFNRSARATPEPAHA